MSEPIHNNEEKGGKEWKQNTEFKIILVLEKMERIGEEVFFLKSFL